MTCQVSNRRQKRIARYQWYLKVTGKRGPKRTRYRPRPRLNFPSNILDASDWKEQRQQYVEQQNMLRHHQRLKYKFIGGWKNRNRYLKNPEEFIRQYRPGLRKGKYMRIPKFIRFQVDRVMWGQNGRYYKSNAWTHLRRQQYGRDMSKRRRETIDHFIRYGADL